MNSASSKKLQGSLKYLYGVLFSLLAGYIIVQKGMVGAGIILALPFLLGFAYYFFKFPKLGLYTTLLLAFFIGALNRYLPSPIPYGLLVDILLVLSYVVLFFKYWKELDMSPSYNDVVLLMLIWMGFVVLELFNPLAHSFAAWFYSMRGVALYQLLAFGLIFTVFNSRKDWHRFINIWIALSLLGVLWALKQKTIGVDGYEARWLAQGAHETHIINGKLRNFSYYFDAGTFGAAMGHICIFCTVLFLGPFSKNRKALYLITAILSFYGLMLSGTRGALAIPGAGGILFLIMSKNKKLLISGSLFFAFAFILLKFTTIGQGIHEVGRLRSALNPQDASLQVRTIARQYLTRYLADKPFGTGLGTAGYWGRRFSPNTWMANFETDGLYTRIRAETGRVGHTLFVWMWIYILVRGFIVVWNMPQGKRKYYAMAALSGYAGILLANYGNSVMTQFPTNIITFISVAYVFTIPYWDTEGHYRLPERKKDRLIK